MEVTFEHIIKLVVIFIAFLMEVSFGFGVDYTINFIGVIIAFFSLIFNILTYLKNLSSEKLQLEGLPSEAFF